MHIRCILLPYIFSPPFHAQLSVSLVRLGKKNKNQKPNKIDSEWLEIIVSETWAGYSAKEAYTFSHTQYFTVQQPEFSREAAWTGKAIHRQGKFRLANTDPSSLTQHRSQASGRVTAGQQCCTGDARLCISTVAKKICSDQPHETFVGIFSFLTRVFWLDWQKGLSYPGWLLWDALQLHQQLREQIWFSCYILLAKILLSLLYWQLKGEKRCF